MIVDGARQDLKSPKTLRAVVMDDEVNFVSESAKLLKKSRSAARGRSLSRRKSESGQQI
jgi:hypothetical protein